LSVSNPPPIPVPPVEELRAAAQRLTAELDQARLHQAAAYVSMAVDSMAKEPDDAVNDNVFRSDVECQFEADEHGRVWMYRTETARSSAARNISGRRCGGSSGRRCRSGSRVYPAVIEATHWSCRT